MALTTEGNPTMRANAGFAVQQCAVHLRDEVTGQIVLEEPAVALLALPQVVFGFHPLGDIAEHDRHQPFAACFDLGDGRFQREFRPVRRAIRSRFELPDARLHAAALDEFLEIPGLSPRGTVGG